MTSVTKLTLINKLIPWVSQSEKEDGKHENRSNNLMDPVLALSQNQLDYNNTFSNFLLRFCRFIGWQDSLVQKMSSKFRVELEIFTVLCQTRLFGKREKKRARTPTRACRVWLPFFDSLVYAYSV